jgi:hypothetical protein
MKAAPHRELPRRAVPEAAEEHDEEEVEVGSSVALAVAAQSEIQVVAQKTRQGHMPAPPEVNDIGGFIRRVEVERELDSEHAR